MTAPSSLPKGNLASIALAAAVTTLSACGPRFDVSADVRDSKVELFVKRAKDGDRVSVRGIEGTAMTVSQFGYATIEIPAEKVGEGKHELTVELTRGDKTKAKKVTVDVPASALVPFLTITSCALKDPHGTAKLKSKALFAGAKDKLCGLQPTGGVDIQVEANADAAVTFGDAKAKIGEDGKGTVFVPILPVLQKLSLRGIGDSKASGDFPLELEATSARAGKSVSVAVELSMKLDDIRDALSQSVLGMDGGKPASWPRSAHDGKPRGVALAVKRHPVKVDGKQQMIRHSTYSDVLVAGEEHKANEIDLFAVATPDDVTKRGACRGYRVISGAGMVRNTGFVMGFDVKVYDHTGKEVATRAFSKPSKTRCPSTLSGTQGETTILVWAPPKDDVKKWLTSLVN